MNRDEIMEWIKEWINTDENLLLVQENDSASVFSVNSFCTGL